MTARFSRLKRLLLLGAGSLAVSACTNGMTDSRQDRIAAACAKQADEIFTLQNPDAVYSTDRYRTGAQDSPYAGIGAPGITTGGLSNRFGHNKNVIDCIRRNGGSGNAPVGIMLPSSNLQSDTM